uniref:Uncharacterized protein n=1 Tax=Peromyscus maniculatus bairdii TaxID=230844 RepID=A0A8C8W8G1_PERMB
MPMIYILCISWAPTTWPGPHSRGKGTYQEINKPAWICFSNISQTKRLQMPLEQALDLKERAKGFKIEKAM